MFLKYPTFTNDKGHPTVTLPCGHIVMTRTTKLPKTGEAADTQERARPVPNWSRSSQFGPRSTGVGRRHFDWSLEMQMRLGLHSSDWTGKVSVLLVEFRASAAPL